MRENRNDIIEYLNKCQNCYSAVLNSKYKSEIQFIKFKRVFENIIIIGVNNNELKYFDCVANLNVSIVIWNKIKGYQLKGYRISKEDEHEYHNEIEKFKNNLKNSSIELSEISLILCYINDIYNVTPGKFAGKLVKYKE